MLQNILVLQRSERIKNKTIFLAKGYFKLRSYQKFREVHTPQRQVLFFRMALKLARSFFKSFFNLLHFDGTFRKRAPSTKILSWQCRYEEIETAGRVYKCAEVCGTDPVLGENVFKSCITRWNAISLPRLNLPCLQLSRRRNNFEQNSIH